MKLISIIALVIWPRVGFGLTYLEYEDAVFAQFNRSVTRQISSLEKIVLDYNLKANEGESPWTLGINYQYPLNNPGPSGSYLGKSYINYRDRNGLFFSANVLNYQSPDYRFDSNQSPFASTFELGHELLQGWSNSPANIQMEINQFDSKIQYFSEEEKFLTAKLELITILTELYQTECSLKDLASVDHNIKSVLNGSREGIAARTIKLKDHLFLENLAKTVETRAGLLSNLRNDAFQSLRKFGENLFRSVSGLKEAQVECFDQLPSLENAKHYMSLSAVELASRIPSVIHAQLDLGRQQKSVNLIKASLRPSLAVVAGGAYNTYSDFEQPIIRKPDALSTFAGLRLTYQLPGSDKTQGLLAASAEASSKSYLLQKNKDSAISEIGTLIQQLTDQISIFPLLIAKRDTAQKLVKVLETQLAIGLIDSTAFGTAYVTYVDSLDALRTSWAHFQNSVSQLREYELVSKIKR